jgi:hypothetical protein
MQERPVIVLPCGHPVDRPGRMVVTVVCPVCPRSFSLELTAGGRVWDSREVTPA